MVDSKDNHKIMIIQSLMGRHPDVKANHVLAVLAMRGDLNRSMVIKVGLKERVDSIFPQHRTPPVTLMLLCFGQIITETPLTEQEVGGGSGGVSEVDERKYSAAALKKRLEERNLLSQLIVPNTYSMFRK